MDDGTITLIVGSADLAKLRIEQDAGCDGLWYRKGETVIVEVGSLPEAVRRSPASELRRLLVAAPATSAPAGSPVAVAPTATPESPTGAIPGGTATPLAVLLTAVAAGLGALIAGRWFARRRSVDKDR